MLHMLFRMLLVFPPVCQMLHTLFRMLPVVYAPLRSAQSNRPPDDLSLPACLLLRMLFRMLHCFLFLLSFSIQKDLIMTFCYLLIFLFVVIVVARL
jgi:hypothetical protein